MKATSWGAALRRACLCGAMALTAVGCGGSSDGTSGGGDSTCSGTLSGTVNAKITDCKFTWANTGSAALVGNDGHITTDDENGANSFYSFGFSFIATGDARVTTLDAAAASVTSASLILSNPNGASLIAYHSNKVGDTGAMVGATTLKISSISQSTAGPTVWDLHGSATATLVPPPNSSYSGQVTVSVNF